MRGQNQSSLYSEVSDALHQKFGPNVEISKRLGTLASIPIEKWPALWPEACGIFRMSENDQIKMSSKDHLSEPAPSVVNRLIPSYFDALGSAMAALGQMPNTIFMGQGVGVAGTTMSDTLNGVPAAKRLELPVAEDMQMGMAIGMAIEGLLPICIFPRWNFMLLAANQLVNHLDRLPLYSNGGYKPKVIIRTAVPSAAPFNPGPQHDDDFTDAFAAMLRTVRVVRLYTAPMIASAYRDAVAAEYSTVLVEFTEQYKNARGQR